MIEMVNPSCPSVGHDDVDNMLAKVMLECSIFKGLVLLFFQISSSTFWGFCMVGVMF